MNATHTITTQLHTSLSLNVTFPNYPSVRQPKCHIHDTQALYTIVVAAVDIRREEAQ
jgi:hypothetical protein